MLDKSCILLILCFTLVTSKNISNVCSTLEAYFDNIATNPHCWYDPEVNGTPKERAAINGFVLEEHRVTTEDGYILLTYRLTSTSGLHGKEVVFLQHGLSSDAGSFMINKENSIAYFLANQGFDVWLGNFRGCDYCNHETLAETDPKYWDFSFHEHGLYDLPANFKYITGKTKRKILYIGHSMGTTSMVIYASTKPDEAQMYIKHAILICPAVFMRHAKGLITLNMINDYYPIIALLPRVNVNVLLGKGSYEKQLLERFCYGSLENANFALRIIDIVFGHSQFPFETEKIPLLLSIIKSMCVKAMFHYLQGIRTGMFRMYDYGPEENRVRYNRETPPDYNLTDISVSMSLIYGPTDNLTAMEDVMYLFNNYRKPNWDIYEIPHNHFDFLFLKVARRTILPLLLKLLNKNI